MITSGNDLPPSITFKLTKRVNIVLDKGYVEINYKHDKFSENEFFYILVDDDKAEIKEGINKFEIEEGEHTIEFIYKRDDCKNRENAIIIEKVDIYGSDEGTSLEAIACSDVKYFN